MAKDEDIIDKALEKSSDDSAFVDDPTYAEKRMYADSLLHDDAAEKFKGASGSHAESEFAAMGAKHQDPSLDPSTTNLFESAKDRARKDRQLLLPWKSEHEDYLNDKVRQDRLQRNQPENRPGDDPGMSDFEFGKHMVTPPGPPLAPPIINPKAAAAAAGATESAAAGATIAESATGVGLGVAGAQVAMELGKAAWQGTQNTQGSISQFMPAPSGGGQQDPMPQAMLQAMQQIGNIRSRM